MTCPPPPRWISSLLFDLGQGSQTEGALGRAVMTLWWGYLNCIGIIRFCRYPEFEICFCMFLLYMYVVSFIINCDPSMSHSSSKDEYLYRYCVLFNDAFLGRMLFEPRGCLSGLWSISTAWWRRYEFTIEWSTVWNWVVVSNIFCFQSYLEKIPILTNIFQRGLVQPPTSTV